MRNLLALVTAVVVMGSLTSPTRTSAWDGPTAEDRMVSLVDSARADAGFDPLPLDLDLRSFARWRSQDMGERDYFSHSIPPDGTDVFDALRDGGYCYVTASESLNRNNYPADQTVERAVDSWLNSPSERVKLLGDSDVLAVGAYLATDGNYYFTLLAASSCSDPTPAPPTPRVTVAPSLLPSHPAPVITQRPSATSSPPPVCQ